MSMMGDDEDGEGEEEDLIVNFINFNVLEIVVIVDVK